MTTHTRRRARRLVVAVSGVFLVLAMAAPALAFVPPGNGAAGNFDCGPAGHPGSIGQFQAMGTGNTSAAWSAHAHSARIVNC